MRSIKWIFAAGFLLSGLYHAVGLVNPSFTEPSPPWRHGLFLLINFIAAFVLMKAKGKVLYVLFPLIIQQIYSHGIYGYQVWILEHRIDWASVIVLITMPILGIYIITNSKK